MATCFQFQEPSYPLSIPSGSLILVSGVNGLIASHIADQLLYAGYNVRGTTRNLERDAWMMSFFDERYRAKDVKFELVKVSDMAVTGAFNSAVAGCAGVVHTTSSISISEVSPEPGISNNVKTAIACLEAAIREPSIKRVILTSSAWNLASPRPNEKFVIKMTDWNEKAIKDAHAEGIDACNSVSIFTAAKTITEKECWKFMERNKPNFDFCSILLYTVFGPVLTPQHQGIPSTVGLINMLFHDENLEVLRWILPQHYIDVTDSGRLHVAALVHPDASNRRLCGHAEPWTWDNVLAMLRRWYPDRRFPEDFDVGQDKSIIEDDLGLRLLNDVYDQRSWIPLEESVRASVDSFVDKQQQTKGAVIDSIKKAQDTIIGSH